MVYDIVLVVGWFMFLMVPQASLHGGSRGCKSEKQTSYVDHPSEPNTTGIREAAADYEIDKVINFDHNTPLKGSHNFGSRQLFLLHHQSTRSVLELFI